MSDRSRWWGEKGPITQERDIDPKCVLHYEKQGFDSEHAAEGDKCLRLKKGANFSDKMRLIQISLYHFRVTQDLFS